MNREELEKEVVAYLRATALGGSRRPVDLDRPLGEMGLGLDSLSLLTFFTGLEQRFGLEFLDAQWMSRSELTLRELIDVIERSEPTAATPLPAADMAAKTRPRSVREAWNAMGVVRGSLWLTWIALRRLKRSVYQREGYAILELSLAERSVARGRPDNGIDVRIGSMSDAPSLADLYTPARFGSARRNFQKRLRGGYICLLAQSAGKTVGVDWLAPTEHADSLTGLVYRMTPGTCCGVDLYEHPEWKGRSVGLTLLIASFEEMETRGFSRQVSVVNNANLPMLAASVQIIGFREGGSITTHWIFRRPISTWRVGKRRGWGGHPDL